MSIIFALFVLNAIANEIVVLDFTNFFEEVQYNNKGWFVMFYAKWCQHS